MAGELERTEAFGAEILRLSVALGGTIFTEAPGNFPEHAVKSAFDPPGLLNPIKAIPSLHRCAEMGRMHVHRGELKFPELERL